MKNVLERNSEYIEGLRMVRPFSGLLPTTVKDRKPRRLRSVKPGKEAFR
jgi:hypothetical protein